MDRIVYAIVSWFSWARDRGLSWAAAAVFASERWTGATAEQLAAALGYAQIAEAYAQRANELGLDQPLSDALAPDPPISAEARVRVRVTWKDERTGTIVRDYVVTVPWDTTLQQILDAIDEQIFERGRDTLPGAASSVEIRSPLI